MGVYDYFKGKCPHCNGQVDQWNGQECGDIQTKAFSGCSFRSFYPGDTMPHVPPSNPMRIGTTACCDKMVIAGFRGKKLLGYFSDYDQYYALIALIEQDEEKMRKEQQEKKRIQILETEMKNTEEIKIRDRMDRIRFEKTDSRSKNQKKHKKRAEKRSAKTLANDADAIKGCGSNQRM